VVVPEHVEREFRRYLDCGILAHSFACARCGDCGHDFLIALSGDEQKAKEAGATAYLAKPYRPFDLLKLIRTLLPEG
jgi:hypothetical protein